MPEAMRQQQDSVVMAVAQAIPEEWVQVVINLEVKYGDDGDVHDSLAFYIVQEPSGKYAKRRFELSPEILNAFDALNAAAREVNAQHWNTCDLVIERTGKYRMDFSFDPPKRLNGVIDEQSYFRFGKYLDTFSPPRE